MNLWAFGNIKSRKMERFMWVKVKVLNTIPLNHHEALKAWVTRYYYVEIHYIIFCVTIIYIRFIFNTSPTLASSKINQYY